MNYWELTLPEQLIWAATFAQSFMGCHDAGNAEKWAEEAVIQFRSVQPGPPPPTPLTLKDVQC